MGYFCDQGGPLYRIAGSNQNNGLEVTYQYLSLEEKINLQYVSKQFQRTVFRRVYEFSLRQIIRPTYSDVTYYWSSSFIPENESELKPIESLLKKCPNLQRIDLDGFQTNNNQISKLMIQMITKYCNHLIEFNGISLNTNDCETQEFCRKFGPKLKYFLFDQSKDLFVLNLFPNIEFIDEYSVVKGIRVEEVLQLKQLNKLKRLKIGIALSKEHLLPQVMQKFENLTHLLLDLNTNALDKAFKDFPSHQNLKDLFITFPYNQDFERMLFIETNFDQMSETYETYWTQQ